MSSEAIAPYVVSKTEMEISLEQALKEITTTMFNCDSRKIPHADIEPSQPGLSAIVGFGGKLSGYLAIHLSPMSACTLASSLLGMTFDEIDDIVTDAMGEMVNMLAGSLKKYAFRHEDLFKISIPSVVIGSSYSTHAPQNAECLSMRFQAGSCVFTVQLVFSP